VGQGRGLRLGLAWAVTPSVCLRSLIDGSCPSYQMHLPTSLVPSAPVSAKDAAAYLTEEEKAVDEKLKRHTRSDRKGFLLFSPLTKYQRAVHTTREHVYTRSVNGS